MAKPRNAAESKAAKAQANAARKAAARQRRAQLWQAFTLQRKEDKRLLPYMIGAFLLIVGASVGVGVWAGGFTMFTMIPLGVLLGALVTFVIFGRRAQRTVYRKAEGQTGAAAWALDNLRGKWRVTPGVAATGNLDAVHRVIGRPGVIFVGEGSAARVKPLLAQEKKAHRATGRGRADLRHYRRQRRWRGSAGQVGAPPHPPSGQHHGQADGHGGVATGGAGFACRCGRHAQGTATHHGQDAQRPAHGPP